MFLLHALDREKTELNKKDKIVAKQYIPSSGWQQIHTGHTHCSHTLTSVLFKESFAGESASLNTKETLKEEGRENKDKSKNQINT